MHRDLQPNFSITTSLLYHNCDQTKIIRHFLVEMCILTILVFGQNIVILTFVRAARLDLIARLLDMFSAKLFYFILFAFFTKKSLILNYIFDIPN